MSAQDGVRVLLVDDTEANRSLHGYWLRTAGYEVLEAVDGERALEVVSAAQPDIVIIDVGLPGIDGLEVCRRIIPDGSGVDLAARLGSRPATAAIPMVMLTADANESQRRKALAAGAVAYLTKPFDLAEIDAVLRGEHPALAG